MLYNAAKKLEKIIKTQSLALSFADFEKKVERQVDRLDKYASGELAQRRILTACGKVGKEIIDRQIFDKFIFAYTLNEMETKIYGALKPQREKLEEEHNIAIRSRLEADGKVRVYIIAFKSYLDRLCFEATAEATAEAETEATAEAETEATAEAETEATAEAETEATAEAETEATAEAKLN